MVGMMEAQGRQVIPPVSIGPGEFRARVAALQRRLVHDAIDVAVVTDAANVAYFCGYRPEHFFLTRSRTLVLLIPATGEPKIVAPASHLQDVSEQTGLGGIAGYQGLRAAPVAQIATAIAELGARRVGLELGFEHRINLTIDDLDRLRDLLRPGTCLADVADAVWSLRLAKSPAELALIEHACGIAAAALDAALPRLRPGITERQLAGHVAAEVALQGGQVAALILTSGSGSYHRGNGAPRARPIAAGELVFVDLIVSYEGYHADFNRNMVAGAPTAEQQALQDRVLAVTEGAARYLLPGVPVAEVYARVLGACRGAGLRLEPPGRVGHGLGLGITEPPHVAADDPTVLAEGMVLTIEPAIERVDGLYCAEIVYAVTPDGGRSLSGAGSALLSAHGAGG